MYNEIISRTLIRKSKFSDSWFLSKYSLNLYRGCEHSCAYCDGRAEKYQVNGEFGNEISIKINSAELFENEIRKIKEKSFIFLGGGVSDAYQPAEKKYKLTQNVLKIILSHNFPVHILTKSALVERDIDLICEINRRRRAVVSFSFSSFDQKTADIFEPGCAKQTERFRILELFKKQKVPVGIMLMPVIPFISDDDKSIRMIIEKARDINVDFILFSGLTMKKGRQSDHFFKIVGENFPLIQDKINNIYTWDQWGSADKNYYKQIDRIFFNIIKEYKIPSRIPHYIFKDMVELNIEAYIILMEIYEILRMQGINKDAYKNAAWKMMHLKDDINELVSNKKLLTIQGIGNVISGIITDIVKQRRSGYYEKIINWEI